VHILWWMKQQSFHYILVNCNKGGAFVKGGQFFPNICFWRIYLNKTSVRISFQSFGIHQLPSGVCLLLYRFSMTMIIHQDILYHGHCSHKRISLNHFSFYKNRICYFHPGIHHQSQWKRESIIQFWWMFLMFLGFSISSNVTCMFCVEWFSSHPYLRERLKYIVASIHG